MANLSQDGNLIIQKPHTHRGLFEVLLLETVFQGIPHSSGRLSRNTDFPKEGIIYIPVGIHLETPRSGLGGPDRGATGRSRVRHTGNGEVPRVEGSVRGCTITGDMNVE